MGFIEPLIAVVTAIANEIDVFARARIGSLAGKIAALRNDFTVHLAMKLLD
jgi:hypothetical protein